MNYKVISFYKYVEVKDSERLKTEVKKLCKELNILGRILIAEEGINGAVCGKINEIEIFKNKLKENELFSDLTFREQLHEKNAYHKLVVKTRKEIVVFGEKVDVRNTGKNISPEELNNLLENEKEVVLLDARNNYEFKVGKFENAVHLDMENFSDFPEKVNTVNNLKNKKIVMYCTGGIRCEKASAFLKEKGFTDINQLKGGIINYVNQFPKKHFKGSCFVFDDRLTAPALESISTCELCNKSCSDYTNCHNLDCDKLFICCDSCKKKMNNCCCVKCKNSPRQRKEKKIIEIIGRVQNYYPKVKIALIKLDKKIKVNSKISFAGKTTPEFEQSIMELRNFNGKEIEEANAGELVTLSVSHRVRVNDCVFAG